MESKDISRLLVVERSEVVLVKPSKPRHSDVSLSLSTIDNNPYFETILKTICVFAPKNMSNHDPATLLQEAISKSLDYYYPLAGKLHRKSEDNRLELKCTHGDGVPFTRATTTCTLSSLSYLDHIAGDLDVAYQLVPCYEPVKGSDEGYDPLALQVTKFACGGISIGMAHSHAVCDGVGMAQFFRAMIELAAGKTQPTVIPIWERERLTFSNIADKLGDYNQNPKLVDVPEACFYIATPPYTLNEEMVREILHITSEDIAKLKTKVEEEEKMKNEKEKMVVTTLEILAAHVWRARCRAMNLSPDETVTLMLAISIRGVMEPPLPEGYYGNAFVNAKVACKTKELSESPLSHAVRLIKDMKRASLDKQYVLRELSKTEETLKAKASFHSPDPGLTIVTDWRQIGLHDNVWGGLVNIIPLFSMKLPHLCAFLPASKSVQGMQGGVRVVVTLPRDTMVKFKEAMSDF